MNRIQAAALGLFALFLSFSLVRGQEEGRGAEQVEKPDEAGATRSFQIAPVEGEPELPMSDGEAEKAGHLVLPRGGYSFRVRPSSGKEEVSGVAVHGHVILTQGMIELFGCAPGGKEHESVLRLGGDVSEIDLALSMSGFQPGSVPQQPGEVGAQGTRLLVFVRWVQNGKMVTYRAEDLIVNVKREELMPRVGWTYVGAWMDVPDPSKPEGGKHKILGASASRSVLTTWRDPWTLLDNPLPDGMDDSAYRANHEVLPPGGTEVLVYFRGPTVAEREEIREVEKKHVR